ncbi:MAG: DUF1772 domain-containing protein [Proteobacteria bacterium]|nr:DUF1772 domain-containing protein [Pseudomonadota bacterium]MBT4358087.1 DUF1772 domain-containing protein [Pseudomonadota bacterium]MBT6656918.1 DUF1772 domain-containing protein [Pseudomonadota bacterium]MBT7671988.1 DUF1772 domain-containing protein [Pseudomonadota bacterium]MBT7812820.1 DUF1772 domain-containing protein [Pseudomonadota bacterium]
MNFLEVSLICSILSCTLVTGFTLLYAVVIMPGLSKLDDKEFIKAFQVTDGVIQDNQPLFILIWLGSVISVVGAILSSIISVGLPEAWLIVFVGVVYLLGVQGITLSVHLPLNNRIKKINIEKTDHQMLSVERGKFETRWNFFNTIRTGISFLVSLTLLLVIALR